MEKLVDYFGHIPSWHRSLILGGGLLLFWILEGVVPLVRMQYHKVRHAGLNLFFTLTTVIINFLFAALIILAADYCSRHHIGLLYLFPLPLWLFTLAGLMILDLIGAWLIHWLHHQVKVLWKFHLVHHSDTWVDTTLGWVIVSPDMHKVHHHYQRPLTDSNYGNIFSFWDRLFGTFRFVKDTKTLHYGIDTHPEEKENNRMGQLLGMPFQRYRPPTKGFDAKQAGASTHAG